MNIQHPSIGKLNFEIRMITKIYITTQMITSTPQATPKATSQGTCRKESIPYFEVTKKDVGQISSC